MMKKVIVFLVGVIVAQTFIVKAQTLSPDSAVLALKNLKEIQNKIRQEPVAKGGVALVAQISRMLKYGLWDEALALLNNAPSIPDYQLLRADYLITHDEYKSAEEIVNTVLKSYPANERGLQLRATLQIQAWRLPQAIVTCRQILSINPRSEAADLIMGHALLLQKRYKEGLAVAKKVQAENPRNAGAYMLEADCYFWDQHAEQAEAPLKQSLILDPYNPDARFSYGYAIWRRFDATLLNAMAAQWEIALAVNPLHFSTNWHWGNGHTNLTYADYAQKDDEQVRAELKKADELFTANKIDEAIAYTRVVQKKYPTSVLPLMHRGSLYYSAFDMDRKVRLDSAENIFRQILLHKKHYGPAHNGLAAVIKSKRIPYIYTFDSLNNVLTHLKINDMKNFELVFPDMSYYPGNIAKAMVWNQMYSAVVYFPFLAKQGNYFRISPLHIDLAITMNQPSFRYTTTFDNRQWMDIRGVGSGSADIEYVERGAYQERNVVLHEYTHLYHGSVFTDEESRQVRKHYYKAMAENRTLDYYSQNNESEYLAQTYPAYFEPVKVHPIDFKSMNTTSDLKSKDPEMYAWLDKLVKKQNRYLAGDKSAMADNWAQVYLNLSRRGRGNPAATAAYLDTALTYDSKYIPVFLAYSRLKSGQKDYAAAENWLKKAEAVDPKYAPTYVGYADLTQAKMEAKLIDPATAMTQRIAYLNKSLQLEDDYQERATVSDQLRETYRRDAKIADAITIAEDYGKNGPTVSTYLRDRRDASIAAAASLKAELGYPEPVITLQHLVEQKPQNFEFRTMYANALIANKQYDKAIKTLQEIQRILKASGAGRPGYDLQIAECYVALDKKDSVAKYLPKTAPGQGNAGGGGGRGGRGGGGRGGAGGNGNEDALRYIRLAAASGKTDDAETLLKALPATGDNSYLAEYYYTQGYIQQKDKPELAAVSYESAIKYNPYFYKVYPWLLEYYKKSSQDDKSAALKGNIKTMKIQPGKSIAVI